MIITAGVDLFRLNGQVIKRGINMNYTRLNNIYSLIKRRCYNLKDKNYKDYGARGITVCDEWNNKERVKENHASNTKGWLSFKKWALSNGYTDILTIDRIDNDKGYSPDNCRWVSIKEQNNNRRSCRIIKYNNKSQNLKQWCVELGLSYKKTEDRINKLHWPIEKAFKTSAISNGAKS